MNQLMLIELNAKTAVSLAPHLKQAQIKAMLNGDNYIPILPDFELYRTQISHSCEPTKITTNVIGMKSMLKDAKLLGEFFTQFAAPAG